MAKVSVICIVLLAILCYFLYSTFQPPPLPKLEEKWWGAGKPRLVKSGPRNFKISIDNHTLEDLNYRLNHHRPFVPPLEGIQQQYGMNTRLLKKVVNFWKKNYDWRKREELFNNFPQYMINIQGLDIHYIHMKPKVSKDVKVLPLLLLHGWPGSVREFFDILPMLTEHQKGRRFVFEVIAPHIPGYGFSQPSVRPGLDPSEIALIFKNMMSELGFKKFYIQGGDFGAIILQHLSILFPENVLGFHSNMCMVNTPQSYIKHILSALVPSFPWWYVNPDHYDRVFPLKQHLFWKMQETGYLHIQATKPDTLGVAMTDSPVGLAAYILEKFTTGTNKTYLYQEDGGLEEYFTYTNLLDNVMIYWLTRSATTSFRLYAETFNKATTSKGIIRHLVNVPSACARFKNDLYVSDGILKGHFTNLLHLSDYNAGHFAAFQVPHILAQDIFEAVSKFEKYNIENH